MAQPSYAREKIASAVEGLAVGGGNVKERLWHAYLEFHPLKKEDFPLSLQSDYEWVMKQLTRFGPILDWKGDVMTGSVQNTLGRIQRSTGTKIAQGIFDLYRELEAMRHAP